jgi:hypothetical protein
MTAQLQRDGTFALFTQKMGIYRAF